MNIEEQMVYGLQKNWRMLLMRGIFAVVFGVLTLVWPGVTLRALTILYGAYAFLDGIFALTAAMTGTAKPEPAWWLVVVGLLGIGAGLLTFFWPGITALMLVIFIGAWAIVRGVFEITGAIMLRKVIHNEWLLILGGILSVAFGFLVLGNPGAGALGVLWLIGSYSILFGALMIGLALKIKNHRPLREEGGFDTYEQKAA